MLETKADFDEQLAQTVQKVQDQLTVRNTYGYLLRKARDPKFADELKFITTMPYETGIKWVENCIDEFSYLCVTEPETYRPENLTTISVVRAVRAHRKARNKAAKAAKKEDK